MPVSQGHTVSSGGLPASGTTAAVASLTSTAVVHVVPTGPYNASLVAASITLTTAITSSAAIVLTIYRNPTANATTNRVSLGTLTVPATGIVGDVFILNLAAGANANPGESFTVAVTTAAAGGGAAGAGIVTLEYVRSAISSQLTAATITKPVTTSAVGSVYVVAS